MNLKKSFLFLLTILALVSCGAQNNSGDPLRTSGTNVQNSSTDIYGNPVGQQAGELCGTIFSESDGFSIQFKFFTQSKQYNLQAGDDRTQSLLHQMPPNVYAYNICGKAQVSGNTVALRELRQN